MHQARQCSTTSVPCICPQSINGAEAVAGQGAEKKLQTAFDKAEANAPAILLIDEIDAIIPAR